MGTPRNVYVILLRDDPSLDILSVVCAFTSKEKAESFLSSHVSFDGRVYDYKRLTVL